MKAEKPNPGSCSASAAKVQTTWSLRRSIRFCRPGGSREGYVRVVDESGEDYLYPAQYFAPLRFL